MAWAPLAATISGTLMQTGGALSQASAAKQMGQQEQIAANFRAAQLRQDAGQTRAASQRVMLNERQRADLVASRALAIGGASGAGLSDPTFAGVLMDIAGEGAYREATAIYEGESRAQKMELGAAAAELEGQIARRGGEQRARGLRMQALGTLAHGAAQSYGLYKKFGAGGPKAQGDTSISTGTSWYDAGTPSYSPVA